MSVVLIQVQFTDILGNALILRNLKIFKKAIRVCEHNFKERIPDRLNSPEGFAFPADYFEIDRVPSSTMYLNAMLFLQKKDKLQCTAYTKKMVVNSNT